MGVISAIGAGLGIIGGIADRNAQKDAAYQQYEQARLQYWDNVEISKNKYYNQREMLKVVYDGNVDASNIMSLANYTSTEAIIAATNSYSKESMQLNIKSAMEQMAINNTATMAQVAANTEAVNEYMQLTVSTTNAKNTAIAQQAAGSIDRARQTFETTNEMSAAMSSSQMADVLNKTAAKKLEQGLQGQKKVAAVAVKGEGITAGASRAREVIETQVAVTKEMQQTAEKGESMVDQLASQENKRAVSQYAATREKQYNTASSANMQQLMNVIGAKDTLSRLGIDSNRSNMLAEISNYTSNNMLALNTDKANTQLAYSTAMQNANQLLSAYKTQSSIDASAIKLGANYESSMMQELYIPPFRGIAPDTSWSFSDTLGVIGSGLSVGSSLGGLDTYFENNWGPTPGTTSPIG